MLILFWKDTFLKQKRMKKLNGLVISLSRNSFINQYEKMKLVLLLSPLL